MITETSIRKYILDEFMPSSKPEELTDDLDLIATNIMDSLAVLKLISYIEMERNISFDPDELDIDNLNSVNSIMKFIELKKSS